MPPSAGDSTAVACRCRVRRGQRLAERVGKLGILQHERALKIALAVQPRGQAEVPFEERARAGTKERLENVPVDCMVDQFVDLRHFCRFRRLSSKSLRIRLYSSAQLVSSVNA